MQKLENTLVPSLLAGAVGTGIYLLMYGNPGIDIPLGPIDVPVWAAVGATVAIGNAAGEILTQYVLPMIPKNENFQKYENLVIPPAMAGITTYIAMRFLVSENTELLTAFGIGAGASVGAGYIYGML